MINAIKIPEKQVNNEDQQKLLYRAIERLRLLHNGQKDDSGRKKCIDEQVKVFAQLNTLRDCQMISLENTPEALAITAARANIKEEGKKAVEYDEYLDVNYSALALLTPNIEMETK